MLVIPELGRWRQADMGPRGQPAKQTPGLTGQSAKLVDKFQANKRPYLKKEGR